MKGAQRKERIDARGLERAIHLWSANLDQVDESGEDILDVQERERAAAYRIPLLRKRFVKSRLILRRILSVYLNQPAPDIGFLYHGNGKPYLKNHPLYFNLSHSHEQWLVALTGRQEIGADVQKMEQLSGMDAIIRRYFPKEEQERLGSLSQEQKKPAFYHLWTVKEAFVKAHGRVLAGNLGRIRQQGKFICWENEPERQGETVSWLAGENFMAALAVKGEMKPVFFLDWPRDYRNFQKGTINDASGRYRPPHHWLLD